MNNQPSSQTRTTDPSLIQLGRDLSATLLVGNLDQSLALLLDHADRTEYRFSDQTRARLRARLSETSP
ncbi:hypothetical protein FDK21_01780 [Cohaesibacter sp. CAU 1516]|uniref:hypothetical protein n=1 Tax=Cohaesibacter sp. CAU 1516 TaxID=2576038 RepID=UPI0010FE2217|nr:hypothetical protein [Cohaesibacter sp. CAU 1516]TLP48413.1 hypothetical protein FDK21_01780 [Cohaesibacter sp. CAU 1516]